LGCRDGGVTQQPLVDVDWGIGAAEQGSKGGPSNAAALCQSNFQKPSTSFLVVLGYVFSPEYFR
jgi:hypothetical protein